MGRMIMYGIAIAGSFALAAGGSWYLNQEPTTDDDKQNAADVENSDPDSTNVGDTDTDVSPPAIEAQAQAVPSAIPPRSMSAEDLYRIGEIMKGREEAIARREKMLETEDRRIKLVMRDIDAEQQETDGLFTQVRGTLESATEMLDQLRDENERLSAVKTKQEETTPTDNSAAMPSPNEMKNAKRWSNIFQGMDPSRAAEYLTEMADEGDTQLVIRIVSLFEERKASKILEAMPDNQLVTQLAAESYKLRHPDKKADRR